MKSTILLLLMLHALLAVLIYARWEFLEPTQRVSFAIVGMIFIFLIPIQVRKIPVTGALRLAYVGDSREYPVPRTVDPNLERLRDGDPAPSVPAFPQAQPTRRDRYLHLATTYWRLGVLVLCLGLWAVLPKLLDRIVYHRPNAKTDH